MFGACSVARRVGLCDDAFFHGGASMRIEWRSPTDRDEVVARIERAQRQRKTLQRDRLTVVLLAGDGDAESGRELYREQIAERVRRSRQFVDEWVGRYRRGGLDAIAARKQPGRAPKLTPQQDEWLKARLDAGPRPEDKVCTLRGRDVRRIVEAEFGVAYSANGVYDLLARLDYSSLKPRPRHRKNDPQEAQRFVERAPLLSAR
jgi:transposase